MALRKHAVPSIDFLDVFCRSKKTLEVDRSLVMKIPSKGACCFVGTTNLIHLMTSMIVAGEKKHISFGLSSANNMSPYLYYNEGFDKLL